MTEEKRLVLHHTHYKELHGYDSTVLMTQSEHVRLHKALRRDGKCNVSPNELQKISTAAWHRAHPETKRAWDKAYRDSHREEINTYKKAYRESHRDELATKQRVYRESHRDVINEKQREQRRLKNEALGT